MALLLPLGVLAIGAIVLAGSILLSKQTDRSWAAAAAQLGLDFGHGGLLAPRVLSGVLDGFEVVVETFEKGGVARADPRSPHSRLTVMDLCP